jgi:hypothetical protein
MTNGVPQVASTVKSQYSYFKFDLDDASNFTVSISPLNGDPDLYISTLTPKPNNREYQWTASEFGFDLQDITTDLPAYKASTTYYISVYGFLDTVFVMSVNKFKDYVELLEGLSVTSDVGADEFRYFKHTLKTGGQRLSVTIVPLSSRGDPDLFITDDISTGPPSPTNCKWCAAQRGSDVIPIEKATAGVYYIGVKGFLRATRFQMIAVTEASSSALSDGITQPGYVEKDKCTYYRYGHGDEEASIAFTVIPNNGDVQVFSSMENTRPDVNKHDKKAQRLEGDQRYIFYDMPTEVGTYYIGVCGVTAANFTILAATNQTYTLLTDADVSIWHHVPTGYYRYFIFDNWDINIQDLSISVFPWLGDVDLYVSTVEAHPTKLPATHTWSSDNMKQDTVVIAAGDQGAQGKTRFFIGVYGASYTGDNYFSILALLSNSTVTLSEGVSSAGAVTVDRYRYYAYTITNPGSVTITLELVSGSDEANFYVSRSTPKPNKLDSEYESINFGNDYLTIDNAHPGTYYIAVYGSYASGSSIGYTISARQNYQSLPTNRINMIEAAAANEKTVFHTMVSEDATGVMFACTLINGRTKMSIFSNSSKDFKTATPDFHSESWPGNAVYVDRADPKFIPGEWVIVVESTEESDYFISASVPDYFTWIREGVPRLGVLPKGKSMLYAHFLPYVDPKDAQDYYLNIRVMRGSLDVYVGQDYNKIPDANYNLFSSKGPNDRLMLLDKVQLNYRDNLYIALDAPAEGGVHYEISLGKSSTPKYMALDQPQTQVTDNGLYSYFRLLGSVKHPKEVLVYVESCEALPAPIAFISSDPTNKSPNVNRNDYSTVPTKSKYVQYLKTQKKLTEEYYLGVLGSTTTSRQYSVYATMDQDSRPQVKRSVFTGVTKKSQVELSLSSATPPDRFKDKKLVYVVYLVELTKTGGKYNPVNFETACSIQKVGTEVGKAREDAGKTVKYLVDIDAKKEYMVNVIVHDSLGLATPYTPAYIKKGKFIPLNGTPSVGVSVGGVFILLSFIAIVAYIIIGIGYNFYKGEKGLGLVPHREFWMDVPFLILDGFKFAISCGRSDRSYEQFEDEHTVPTSGFGSISSSSSSSTTTADKPQEQPVSSGYGTL